MIQNPEIRTWIRRKARWSENVVAGLLLLLIAVMINVSLPRAISHPGNPTLPTNSPQPVLASTSLSSVKPLPKTPIAAPYTYHTRWGDSLWSIANRFHVSIHDLRAANHLTSTTIYAGQTLVIPSSNATQIQDTPSRRDRQHPLATASQDEPSVWESRDSRAESTPSTILYSRQDLRLLAHLVHAEAGTQPFLGQVAVAAVVINRVKAPGFPKTISQVIEEPGQFESVTNGSIWERANSTAYRAAAAALKGWDPTHGALYFYNPSLPFSRWMSTLPITSTIAGQLFCR